MNMQQNITEFESQFNGSFPFSSDGVVVGTPPASFEEEMETMITFSGGLIDTDTLYHENMHQWWGDNVTEGGYTMTFYKEGLATLAEYLYAARRAETAAGGPYSPRARPRSRPAWSSSSTAIYAPGGGFWTVAPSNPTPYSAVLGPIRPTRGRARLHRAAADPGPRQLHPGPGAHPARLRRRSITEPELEAAFRAWLPNPSAACQARLGQFFRQWFDTAYPTGGGAQPAADHRPGPGRTRLLRRPRLPPQLAGDAAAAPDQVIRVSDLGR